MAYLMIVDDDEDFAAAVAVALVQEGHEVAIQTDIASAMMEMQTRPPDLVISDVMFPGDDFAGLQLARAMQGCRGLDRIPILMLTGINPSLGMKLDTLDIDNSWMPVSDFVDKPVEPGVLVGKVKAMLEGMGPRENDGR